MDTDSCHLAITAENFEDLIKPELKEDFIKDLIEFKILIGSHEMIQRNMKNMATEQQVHL